MLPPSNLQFEALCRLAWAQLSARQGLDTTLYRAFANPVLQWLQQPSKSLPVSRNSSWPQVRHVAGCASHAAGNAKGNAAVAASIAIKQCCELQYTKRETLVRIDKGK